MHNIKRHWDAENRCIYCKTEIKVIKSEHFGRLHYKTARCEKCNRKLSIQVPFNGSGHDTYKTITDLEKRLIKTKDIKWPY
jgi:hypothetical protein